MHHGAGHIRQAEVSSRVTEGELLVVEAELMQDRRVQVTQVNFVHDGVMSCVLTLWLNPVDCAC